MAACPLDWRSIFLLGSRWDEHDAVYDGDWDFSHLPDVLARATDGVAATGGSSSSSSSSSSQPRRQSIFLFGAVEPQWVGEKVVPIPTLVALVLTETEDRAAAAGGAAGGAAATGAASPWNAAPVEYLACTSVQMNGEDILPFSALRLAWQPVVGVEGRKRKQSQEQQHPSQRLFYLTCNVRAGRRGRMPDGNARRYEYAMPYTIRDGGEPAPVTDVMVQWRPSCRDPEERPLSFSFDKTVDRLRTFIPEFLEEHQLFAAEGRDDDNDALAEELEAAIRQAFKSRRAELAQEADARKTFLAEELTDDDRAALDTMRVLKIYPSKGVDGKLKSDFVNRYYGKADEVV